MCVVPPCVYIVLVCACAFVRPRTCCLTAYDLPMAICLRLRISRYYPMRAHLYLRWGSFMRVCIVPVSGLITVLLFIYLFALPIPSPHEALGCTCCGCTLLQLSTLFWYLLFLFRSVVLPIFVFVCVCWFYYCHSDWCSVTSVLV